MENNNFIKNIISKDLKIFQKTIQNLISSKDTRLFTQLCQRGDFIFPNIKEKIITTFVNLIQEKDLDVVFEFSKVYSFDFEDMIIKSWLKFANEDLTDKILILFDEGTNDQKAYCASYFRHIKDPLSIETLNKNAKSDYTPLKVNCAQTLSAFGDKTFYNEMKRVILEGNDDLQKAEAFEFLCAYKGQEAIELTVKYGLNNPYSSNIISNLFEYNNLNEIKFLDDKSLIDLYNCLIEGYPETINLDTIAFFEILEFSKLLYSKHNQYAINSLIYARIKFLEFSKNDVYSYDLDKFLKNELKEISNYLEGLSLYFDFLYEDDFEFGLSLNIIQELQLYDFAPKIADLVNSFELKISAMAQAILCLKELEMTYLINKDLPSKIANPEVKEFISACLK
ncbi:hypothetical protein IJ670_06590 [bacterium]|nr:hypothetical protein [bacterium]